MGFALHELRSRQWGTQGDQEKHVAELHGRGYHYQATLFHPSKHLPVQNQQ